MIKSLTTSNSFATSEVNSWQKKNIQTNSTSVKLIDAIVAQFHAALVDDELENSAFHMNEKLRDSFRKDNNAKDTKKKLALLELNNRNIQESLDQCEKEYEKIAPIVESSEDYSQTEKFQGFLDGLEKKNDLEVNFAQPNSY